MKRLLFPVVVAISFAMGSFMLIQPVKAVTISPNSGTKTTNTTSTLQILANPQGSETLVKLNLAFTNATVLSFTPNTSVFGLGAFPDCIGGTTFTSSTVCASLASSQTIPSGALIATITVRWGAEGTATISAITGNLYRDSSTDRADVGLKATYTVTSSGGTDLPSTPLISAEADKYILSLAGGALIVVGFILKKKSKKEATYNY